MQKHFPITFFESRKQMVVTRCQIRWIWWMNELLPFQVGDEIIDQFCVMWTSVVMEKEYCSREQSLSPLRWHFPYAVGYWNTFLSLLLFSSWRHQYQTLHKSSLDSPRILSISLPCWALNLEFSQWQFVLSFPNWTAGVRFVNPIINPQFITSHYLLQQFGSIFFVASEESLHCYNSFLHFQDQFTWNPKRTNFTPLRVFPCMFDCFMLNFMHKAYCHLWVQVGNI